MNHFTSRAYSGAADLDLLIDFARKTTAARWPRSTYMKAGDVVWGLGSGQRADIRLWFDNDGLAAYTLFDPPLYFDFAPGVSLDDSLADEILEWAEARRRSLLHSASEKIPKAWTMLGGNTLSTHVLDSDPERIALLKRRGYTLADRFDVLYSMSLVEGPIAQPKLAAGLVLRHATDADLEARVDVHRDAWSVWGPSKISLDGYRKLRSAPLYDPELDVVLEDADGSFQLLHRMAGHRKWLRTFRASRMPPRFHRTRIRPRRDD